jgi:hypothetical protein
MAVETRFPGFSCDDCGAVSIRIEGRLMDATPVRCGGCGKHLGAWDTFSDALDRMRKIYAMLSACERPEHRYHA